MLAPCMSILWENMLAPARITGVVKISKPSRRLLIAFTHLTCCSNLNANILCRGKSQNRINYTITSPEHIWRVWFRECLLLWRIWLNLGRILKWLSCPSFKSRRWDMDAFLRIFSKLFTEGNKNQLFKKAHFWCTETLILLVNVNRTEDFFVKVKHYKKKKKDWKKTQI